MYYKQKILSTHESLNKTLLLASGKSNLLPSGLQTKMVGSVL